VARVDDLVQLEGRWTLVMEYVRGVSLKELAQATPVPLRCALELTSQVADALRVVYHTESDGRPLHLIHRDLKPSNIMLDAGGEVKLLDFGIARADFTQREAETQSMILGSIGYMAPERWDMVSGPESDIYALGVVLLETLGRRRFGRAAQSVRHQQEKVEAAIAELGTAFCQPAADLMFDMLQFEPSERPSADEVDRRCRQLLAELQGPWLRDWAEKAVPPLLQAGAPQDDDPVCGATLEEVRTSMGEEPCFPQEPAPRPRSRLWLPLALALLCFTGLGICGGGLLAWWLHQRSGANPAEPVATPSPAEPQPEPAQREEPTPQAQGETVEPERSPAPAQATTPAPAEPVSSPEAEAQAEEEAPATGRVLVTGDVEEVWLVSGSQRLPPGDIPVGSYQIQFRIPGRGLLTGETFSLGEGQELRFSCDAAFAMCRSR